MGSMGKQRGVCSCEVRDGYNVRGMEGNKERMGGF